MQFKAGAYQVYCLQLLNWGSLRFQPFRGDPLPLPYQAATLHWCLLLVLLCWSCPGHSHAQLGGLNGPLAQLGGLGGPLAQLGIAHTLDKRHTDITYKLAHGLNLLQ